ncbi:hypothetical protein ABZP36_014163 [Zizania latifolia]
MAAAGAPAFSIREYAARARAGAADEGRCWPFGGEAGPLPPMEVRRFRWWEDEASVAEEEGEEERRMAAKRRKRSIVELFAAVPQVAGGGEGLGRGKRIKRKVDKGELPLGVEAKKKGFKKDKVVVDIGVTKRGKSSKTKVTSASMSQLFQDAIQKQKQKKSIGKKKGIKEVSVLLKKKNMKGNKVAVLSRQKATKSICHAQSILKKHLKTGKGTLLKDTGVMSPSNSLLKPKHVTFSDDNGILGQTASRLGDVMEKSQLLQASQQSYEDGKSQGRDDQRGTYEPQFTYKRAGAGLETVEEDTGSTVPLTKSKQKTILGNSVDLNHCLEMSTSGNCFSSFSSAVLSSPVLPQNFAGMDSCQNDGLNLAVGFQAEGNCHKYPGSSVIASLAVKARSGDLIRQQLSQSSSCLVSSLHVNDRSSSKMPQERCVEPPSTLRNSNGRKEYPSCFSSVSEAELRRTQNAATVPSYSPNNSFNSLVETRPVHSQFSYFPQQLNNVTQRTPISSFLSGYAVQSTPGLTTTQTKFTSLRPLPPSVISSHVYSSEDAQPHGSVLPFYPSNSLFDHASKYNAGGDIKDNRSMQQTPIKSNHGSSEQMNRRCKIPAGKGDVFLTPRKPCIAVEKDLNLLPLQEGAPVCLSKDSAADLRIVNSSTQTAWSDSVNRVGTRPVKLKSGAKHILEPGASATVGQERSWPVHSIKKFALEDDARTGSTSKKRDAEVYKV